MDSVSATSADNDSLREESNWQCILYITKQQSNILPRQSICENEFFM